MNRLVLHIDRLSLPAMPPAERQALLEALQAGLQARLASPQTLQRVAGHAGARHVALRLPPRAARGAELGRSLGEQLARFLDPAA